MKKHTVFFLAMATILLASCSVRSLHPIYDEASTISKTEILGIWKDGDSTIYEIEAENTSSYTTKQSDGYLLKIFNPKNDSNLVKMYIHLVEIDQQIFWDLFPTDEYENNIPGVMTENLLPVHTFGKMEIQPDLLKVYYFKGDWLAHLFEQNKIRIPHEKITTSNGSSIVLTASTSELQKFILKYHKEIKAFEDPIILTRIKN